MMHEHSQIRRGLIILQIEDHPFLFITLDNEHIWPSRQDLLESSIQILHTEHTSQDKCCQCCNANCILLGHKYTMKKTCLSCVASHFDESYASPGYNGKKSWFFTHRQSGKSQKTLFLQHHLWAVPTWDQ